MEKEGKDSSDEATGDGSYSTAPSSPDLMESKRRESYDIALRSNQDKFWDWHTGPTSDTQPQPLQEQPHPLSTRLSEISQSPPVPKHVGLNKTRFSHSNAPEVVNANPFQVQVGFNTPQSLETTKLSSLPGTEVITSPPILGQPHPHLLSKPCSIEDFDKARRHYAPTSDLRSNSLNQQRVDSPERDSAGFCLDLASLSGYVATPTTSKKVDSSKDVLSLSSMTSLTSIDSRSRSLSFDMKDVFHENEEECLSPEELYADFLKSQTCYDLIPGSTKLVVFDTKLKVKKAFFALVINGVRSAPLWDCDTNRFVGMLTITDFINILKTYYKSPIVGMDELEEQTIQTWRVSVATIADVKSILVQIDPLESLYEAVKVLVENKIHRLPIIDRQSGNSLYIATHKRILHYMYYNLINEQQPSYMKQSLQELGIGTYREIATATSDTPIITALNQFTERRISALPIVDNTGKVVDIYAKFDVINLAAERTYNNLDVSLRDALKHRAEGFEGVLTCLPSDSLGAIIKKIVNSKVHRLVIVNEDLHVIGVLSLSDILRFVVLTPHSK